MELIPDWAPNIHPLLVHFPIAILTLAVSVSLIEVFLIRDWISKSRLWLYIFGSLSAIVTVLSGRAAADSVSPPFSAEMTLSNHSDSAYIVLWYFLAFTMIQLVLPRFIKIDKTWVRIAYFLIACFGLSLLITTGDLGAKLVYKYGVGTP
jgi:uncharacterized membrane protein